MKKSNLFKKILSLALVICMLSSFAIPAMGSHGGASAEGQLAVLHSLGITEETIGCPIHSSMETVQIGHTEEGQPVYIDRHAAESDGIILINRIKPHTSFRGKYESGLMKMMAIGLGKQRGAETCHAEGFDPGRKQTPWLPPGRYRG